jgi:hypothetical protein
MPRPPLPYRPVFRNPACLARHSPIASLSQPGMPRPPLPHAALPHVPGRHQQLGIEDRTAGRTPQRVM